MAFKNDQVSSTETEYIIKTAQECLDTPGDYVELGCYRGDTSLALAEVLKDSDKHLWLYDSFEGLPEKSPYDSSVLGENFVKGALSVSKREVKARFLRAGLRVPIIKKGWFSEFTLKDLPGEIAFCFLDGDFYESIRDGLQLVWGNLSDGATIIVHDYNNPELPGVRRAVDEWISSSSHPRELHVVETCAVIRCEHV